MADYTLSAKVTADSKQFESSMDNASKKVDNLEKNVTESANATQKATKALNEVSSAGDGVSKVADNSRELGSSMTEASNQTTNFNNSISQTSKASQLAKSAIKGVVGVVGAVGGAMAGAIGMGVKYNSEIETYQTSFEVMTGSAEKATQTVEELKKMGAATPFELPELADTTQLLMNYGFTADDAINRMSMLGDISQGNADKMQRVATAYGQMSSAGKVSLEDVKQMIEAGFNPLQEISESTGESMSSLYDRISDGTLSVDEITQSMQRATSEGGKYFQSMEKQSQTFKGQLSTMKDNATQLLGELASSTSQEMTGNLLPTVNQGLSDMMNALKTNGFAGMAEVGGGLIANLVTSVISKAPDLITMAFTMITSFLTGIQSNIPMIVTSILSVGTLIITNLLGMLPQLINIGFSVIISLVQGITQQLPTLIPTVIDILLNIVNTLTDPTNLSMLIGVALDLIFTLAQGLLDAIPKLISAVPMIIKNVVSTLIKLLPKLIPVALQLIVTLATGLINYIPTLLSYLPMIITAIIGAFKEQDWGQIGKDIINGLIKGLESMLSGLWNSVKNIAKGIGDTFKDLLGIHSPSKLFMQFGIYTDKGYAIGIDKGKKQIYKELSNLQIPQTFESSKLPTTSTVSAANTVPMSQARADLSGFGDYVVSATTSQFSKLAEALEKGIGSMRMVADGRETARFVSSLGFQKAGAR